MNDNEEMKEIEERVDYNNNYNQREELGAEMEEVSDQSGQRMGNKRMAPWTKHITIRGLVVSFVIGMIYSVIVTKLNLTTGLVPNLNVSAALLAFVFVKTWTELLQKIGFVSTPFTQQENTIIQTCAVACYSIAVGGTEGFEVPASLRCCLL